MGKTAVAAELHAELARRKIRHCLVEGDTLDQAWPAPHEQGLPLAEENLRAISATYRRAGYGRMVYTNTAAVRGDVMASLLDALGDDLVVHAVLLTVGDEIAEARLARREVGSTLANEMKRSRRAAVELARDVPDWVHRIATDGRDVAGIAEEVLQLINWEALPQDL